MQLELTVAAELLLHAAVARRKRAATWATAATTNSLVDVIQGPLVAQDDAASSASMIRDSRDASHRIIDRRSTLERLERPRT
jgi:hypothetical protein